MVNFSILTAEICWRVWGTPANFNGFRVLVALLHSTPVVGVSQTLWRWTEGATYIWQGGHHVGHWPTLLVVAVVVQDCLLHFSKEEKMTGDSKWDCPRCKCKRDATKRLVIWRLPPILLVILKRLISTHFAFSMWKLLLLMLVIMMPNLMFMAPLSSWRIYCSSPLNSFDECRFSVW